MFLNLTDTSQTTSTIQALSTTRQSTVNPKPSQEGNHRYSRFNKYTFNPYDSRHKYKFSQHTTASVEKCSYLCMKIDKICVKFCYDGSSELCYLDDAAGSYAFSNVASMTECFTLQQSWQIVTDWAFASNELWYAQDKWQNNLTQKIWLTIIVR